MLFSEAGSLHEVSQRPSVTRSLSAKESWNLAFEPIVNNATVAGMQVLDEAP